MKIHYSNRVQTRCGKSVDLYTQINTTRSVEAVTCKQCLKSLKPVETRKR